LLNILGFLVVVPSSPDNFFENVFAIMSLMEKKTWNKKSVLNRIKIYIAIFNYLCTQAQDKLPYNINRVDSNDTIFLGDDQFFSELEQNLVKVFDQIVNVMGEVNNDDRESQAMLSMCMTYTAACLAQNVELSDKVQGFIDKIIKKAEKSYVKCKR
jgi:hypothetical protein